jgi:hypothetical protein
MSNVIPLHPPTVDPKIALEAKEEMDDAVDCLIEAIRLLKMAGRSEVGKRVSAHVHAIIALRVMA